MSRTEIVVTFNLDEAARFLKMDTESLRRKAKAGIIPGAKPGKCWVFVETDLLDYLRSLYAAPRQTVQGQRQETLKWPCTDVVVSIGSASPAQTDAEYNALLGRKSE